MTDSPSAYLRVRVVPRAARPGLARDAGGVLRVHVAAMPVEGAANRALLELLADRLGLPKSTLEITRGHRGRDKVVRVRGCSPADLDSLLTRALDCDVDNSSGRR